MQVRLLGSVDVSTGGAPAQVAGLRRKAILAVLALHAGEIVSTSRLIHVVWGASAATTALNTVQSHVSNLRRLFGDRSAIVARPPGYLLDLPGEPTDVVTAQRLIRAGRQTTDPVRAAELFQAALALWRGTALQDVIEVPWLAEQSDRLQTLQREARRALLDARLALGEHTALIPELRELAAADPFDEQVHAQLVLALYRAGRQADALVVLREVRAMLAAELGLDPGPALRELAAAILRQDPTLTAPKPADVAETRPPTRPARNPATTEGAGALFVGRDSELSTLRRLLDGIGTGAPPILIVTGEPGIGKTRLLGECARRAGRDGRPVLWGRAAEFEQQVPFGIVRNALADHLTALSAADLAGIAAEDLGLLREVLPMVPGPRTDAASREVLTAERYRLHRAVRGLLEVLAVPAGLVLVLDDLHWADHGSAELLDYLLRHPPRGAVLVAVAYRARQLSGRLRQAIGRATQDGVAELVELGPLSPVETDGLLPAGMAQPQRQRLHQASGGNPLYLQALVHTATATANPATGADPLPATVRAALAAEIDALPPTEALVARAAAVAGTGAEPHLLARTADRPIAEVLDALDVLVSRDLLRPVPDTGRFQFRHPLVRRITYDAAGSGWLVTAHARTAAALREQGAPATEQAHHVERAAQRGDLAAAQVLQEAAAATMHSNPAGSAHWLGAALRLVPDDAATMPVRLALLALRAQALGLSGQLRDSRDTLHDLLYLLPAEAVDARTRVAAGCAGIERMLRRHREANALLRTELDRLSDPDGPAAATLLVALAAGNLQDGVGPGKPDWTRQALAAARRTGDRALLTAALVECVMTDQITGRVDPTTTARLDEAALLIDAMPDAEIARSLHAAVWLATVEGAHERVPDAARHTERALALARETGQAYVLGRLHWLRAAQHACTGDLDAAARRLHDAHDAATLAGTDAVLCTVLAAQCGIAALVGDPELAVRLGTDAVAMAGDRQDFFTAVAVEALATAHLHAGDPAACTDLLAGDTSGPDAYVTSPVLRSTWYETAARAAAAQGHSDRAALWADRAHLEVRGWSSPRRQGLAHLASAHALLAGSPAGAAGQAMTAVHLFTAAGDRLRAGHARLVAGTAWAATGDLERARSHLDRARALFELCGAHLPLAQTLREQRRLGAVHIVRLPRRAAVSAPHQRGIKASGHAVRSTEHTDTEETA